ncbi:hypothetical protein [Xenorhabdus szentirmaii]|uniref:hypothetical protein n=1 Tax=Xenorhabdus szentirmaii TaxID=290112 RepID=UPI00198C49C0|nr:MULTISPECIES: hypothetical protein [unclassified Xenorhabdus]MBD2792515.1 hypothetical protein [Xenorhabdus sp. CUL]MBD2826201.1 hypothetical protein [Xenorhabdus sp. 5]
MRFTDDPKIRKSIIKLFTYTEQIILLKSFLLVKNETRDDFTHWIKDVAYEFIDSIKNVTIFLITAIVCSLFYPPQPKIYAFIANYAFFIYLSFSLLAILNKARLIGCGYIVGLKFFLFCIGNKIFFKPKSKNKAYPPINMNHIKVYIEKDEKRRRLVTTTFTFKEQLALLRSFSLRREETQGDFLTWLDKNASKSISGLKVFFSIIFILFIISIIQQPEAWHILLILYFIVLLPMIILMGILLSAHIIFCNFITSSKLFYFYYKKRYH